MAANKVESLRKARSWTRKELAAKVGMSVSLLVKIERGERRIPDDRARDLAAAFGVTAGEVIEGLEEMQRVPVIEVAALPAVAYGAERPIVDRTVPVATERTGLVAIEYEGDIVFSASGIDKSINLPAKSLLILDTQDHDGDGIFMATCGTKIAIAKANELSSKVKPLAKIVQVIGTLNS
ncbi:MAG: hypothetical protein COB46_08125 [Rhodospirillaceae bacterium]|nr:MAG: hypothetical protein COB46_08125 [Rhodospirillaceae bacterium]